MCCYWGCGKFISIDNQQSSFFNISCTYFSKTIIYTSETSPVKRAAAESTDMEWMGSKSGRETILSSCWEE